MVLNVLNLKVSPTVIFPKGIDIKMLRRHVEDLVNNEIMRVVGISFLKYKDMLVWGKLRRDNFHIDSDIYIANVYVVP